MRPLLPLLLLLTAAVGCIKQSNPPVPAYIYVDDVQFQARNPAIEGSASQRITDVWVSVNGQLIGANNLPALLPVILNDTTEFYTVTTRAGIEENGILNRKIDYPFFSWHIETRRLQPAQIDTIRAVVRYDSSATIQIVEDFENVGIIWGDDLDGNANTSIIKSQEDVFEGTHSGKIVVDSGNLACTAATSIYYSDLQPVGSAAQVFMEMNYKTELPIRVGLRARYANGSTETTYLFGVNPKDSWNKIYFNLSQEVFTKNAQAYAIVFDVVNSSRMPAPKVYIDNVKLLHY